MEEVTRIKTLINNLKVRKGMYVFDDSYSSLTSFLIGYFVSIRELTNIDYSGKFKKWLEIKEKGTFAVHWSGYVLREISNDNPSVAELNLIALLEEYLDSEIEEKNAENNV